MKRIHLRISGLVQGVGFRHATRREARGLGLSGWVRNTGDGDVEVVAEGPEAELQRLLRWCHTGPSGARVATVLPRWQAATGEFAGFEIAW